MAGQYEYIDNLLLETSMRNSLEKKYTGLPAVTDLFDIPSEQLNIAIPYAGMPTDVETVLYRLTHNNEQTFSQNITGRDIYQVIDGEKITHTIDLDLIVKPILKNNETIIGYVHMEKVTNPFGTVLNNIHVQENIRNDDYKFIPNIETTLAIKKKGKTLTDIILGIQRGNIQPIVTTHLVKAYMEYNAYIDLHTCLDAALLFVELLNE